MATILKRHRAVSDAAGGRPRRLSRDELAGEVRDCLFRAAADVVGRHGYAGASISKITERAGMAQGTFYLYFPSRQALFDELLPYVGREMIEFVHAKVKGAKGLFDMEERGFRAFFEYLETHPGFFIILNEAEVAAPVAYEAHFRRLSARYIHALRRSVEAGEIKRYGERELEALAFMLIATRSYMYLRYVKSAKGKSRLPDWVIGTYMKLIRNGIS